VGTPKMMKPPLSGFFVFCAQLPLRIFSSSPRVTKYAYFRCGKMLSSRSSRFFIICYERHMRNFFVFNFWFVVHIFIIGALAGFWLHLDSSNLTDSELGQRIGHLLGFWALGLPWFATFFGWHFA